VKRLTILFGVCLAACLAACGGSTAAPTRPMRIVSLDYCADQYVLALVERERILALSPDARKNFSYYRAAAAQFPSVSPREEDVLALAPDLVVRTYGGGPNAAATYARAGIAVVDIGYADTLADVRQVLLQTAAQLGASQRGARLAEDMRQRLATISTGHKRGTALYITPGGVTSGPGTLVGAVLSAAGFENFQAEPGWQAIPLERLAYETPDVIVAGFAESYAADTERWSVARHPVVRTAAARTSTIFLPASSTACGGWFVVDAIERLAAAG
jgi:iron complex transport system substrate-binding protein